MHIISYVYVLWSDIYIYITLITSITVMTGTETYVQSVAYCDCPDALAQVQQLVQEPFFNMALAGHARSVTLITL